jgi:hypothetical protein
MLRTLSSLRPLSIRATDGEIGSIKDSYFDDQRWVVRYVVVDTGRWLPGRLVLISPHSISGIDWERDLLHVSITRQQVKASPDIDTHKPISRQHEEEFLDYYGYPYYWGGAMFGGIAASPAIPRPPPRASEDRPQARNASSEQYDPNLRSAEHVSTYDIEADDGLIGHVGDFIFDERTWALRYLVVDTRKWLPGRRVLVATEWIEEVNWEKRVVRVPLSRDGVRNSPEWDEDEPLTEGTEQSIYRHYGRTMMDAGHRGGQVR